MTHIPYTEPFTPPACGIISNLPASVYHARPEISKHGLDDFNRCPAWFKYRREHPQETTPALRWGSLVDDAVFMPDEFWHQVAIIPTDAPSRPTERNRKAKKPSEETIRAIEFWDKFDKENAGKEILTIDEAKTLTKTRGAILSDETSAKLFSVGTHMVQPSLFWQDAKTGVACRARPDMIRMRAGTAELPDVILDLKTAASAEPEDFGKSAHAFRYDVQAAIYSDAWRAITGRESVFVFIVVEKAEPYFVANYVVPPAVMERGRRKYELDLFRYAECLASGKWPGYTAGIQELKWPGWDRE